MLNIKIALISQFINLRDIFSHLSHLYKRFLLTTDRLLPLRCRKIHSRKSSLSNLSKAPDLSRYIVITVTNEMFPTNRETTIRVLRT